MAKNTTILEGIILDEPSLYSTHGGVSVSNFNLQVEDKENNISFSIGITAWGKKAEEYATKYSKDSKVRINGKLARSPKTCEMEVQAEHVFVCH